MKRTIAEAAQTLLVQRHVKKLTVKDIVEECHITRQAFYYHFADIPELLRWMIEGYFQQVLGETLAQEDGEAGLRCFFVMAINAAPYVEHGMKSNYGEELERQLEGLLMGFLSHVAASRGLYARVSAREAELLLRYHCGGVMFLLRDWKEQDTAELDAIAHRLYQMMIREENPL